MSRRANPKLVGAFVLTAIALLVGAALVFGSFTFFEVTRRFVVFFQGSVDGLTQGSAVLFRGVPLGRVVDVGIRYDPSDSSFEIPVIIEIRPGVIARYSPPATVKTEFMKQLIDAGLRARLESASLVTGQQVVQLNFFPGTPIKLEETDLPYPQLPTVPSPTQQIMSSVDVAAQDLPTLIKEATAVLDRLRAFLSPENEAAVNALLENAAAAMKTLAADAQSLRPLIGEADSALVSVGQLTTRLNSVVQDNREDIRATLRNFREAAAAVAKLMDQLNQVVATNRPPIRNFTEGTLPDLTALIIDARTTVNKATAVLDSIERNPTRFLFGNRLGQGVELK
jgi:phospholipid/cholesterol/gamma-HCH transport system substrate-binding protein